MSCSIKNLINYKKKNLYFQLLDSVENQGSGVDLKTKMHKEAFLKKKVSNYRWF